MDKEVLKQILAGGKDCTKIKLYREAYKHYTGKEYPNGCMSCQCRYLYQFLQNFLR